MLSHVVVGSNDVDRSKRFYDAVLGTLGAGEGMVNEGNPGPKRIYYQHEGITFVVGEPANGDTATVGNGGTVGFRCGSPEQVQSFHDAAVAQGGTSVEDPPGPRVSPAGTAHLAYVRDPDGNKLCAMHWAG